MSINTMMAAIAGKIRSIRGTSGSLTLDAMDTSLGSIQTDITNAFSAVSAKGGTVPSAKTSGNLQSAIASIAVGVNVQRKSGSFTTNNSGNATVNCGFQPDMVYIQGETGTEDDNTFNYSMCMAFAEETRNNIKDTIMWFSDGIIDFTWTRTSSGFTVSCGKYSWEMVSSVLSRKSFTYVAIKYT